MQAIILATGENEKLRPLTNSMPSPMVPIVNRPVMSLAVELLARHNIKKILVSMYDRAGNIEAYFHEGNRWGVQFEYLLQREALGSAGALKWAKQQLHETFLLLPADSILDLDITAAMAFHHAHGGRVTMILHQSLQEDDPHAPVWLHTDGRVTLEATDGTLLSATKAYIFEPSILESIPARTHYDCYNQLIPQLLEAGIPIYGYQMSGYWNRLDSFQSYQNAQEMFLRSASDIISDENMQSNGITPIRYSTIEGYQFSQGIWIGRDNIIHPNVRLTPPVCIGHGCRIGRKVELGPRAVIGSNVIIDDEATVCNTTILDNTYVGQLVNLDNRIVNKTLLIDIETSESTEVVDEFLLAEASPTAIGGNLRRFVELIGAILLLILTWQATFLIGLATFITTGGTLFRRVAYVAKGPGRIRSDGIVKPQTFHLLHFETRRADGRLTWLGGWLEKWQLHRLPELWNVVQGELGFVGVKPLSPEESAQITEEWQLKRYEYPAGITGLWYIQTNANSELDEILITDAYYAATRTWRGDWKLLLQTPAAWLKKVRMS